VRIVRAEDSALLREGLVRLLEELGHQVAATAGTADEALAAVRRERPEALVTDVRMPPTHTDDGLRAAVRLRRELPELAVLVLSQYVEAPYARKLLQDDRGGVGYLLKDHVQDLDALADALRRVRAGGTVIDPEVVRQLMVRRRAADVLQALSARERQALELMAAGRSNAAIAEAMVVTGGAVEKHIANIFTKLDLAPSADEHRRVLAVLTWLQR
jgi:DNA-binding NarL/FixJ family response regulator